MPHPLETEYGLSAEEMLDAIHRRFRAKVTLEGAVAEVHLGKIVRAAATHGAIARFEEHDQDGYPDFSIWLPGRDQPLRLECKNVRDSDEAYREGGVIVAFKVETQKTRTSAGDPSSRFYGFDQFELLAVCLGKKTRSWTDFSFVRTSDLTPHPKYPGKLAVMHRVPLPGAVELGPWHTSLEGLLMEYR